MRKAFLPLALILALAAALALAIPAVNAGRTSDGDLAPLTAYEISPARDIAALAGLERENGYRLLVVGAAVPGAQAADCQVRLLGPEAEVLEEARLRVEAGSTAQIDFVDRIGSRIAAATQVSCDRPFHPYAAAAGADEPKAVWAEAAGPSGECDFTVNAAELSPGVFVAAQDGTIHNAREGKEKGIVCVKTPTNLKLAKLVLEWDVATGPWHKKTPHANHAMIWLHRGRFRSGTVANVNAFGPRKNFVKMNQNVDMPRQNNTNQKMGIALQPGNQYHLRYTYDAANRKVTTELFEKGALVKRMEMKGTAQNRILSVPAFGFSSKGALFAEFGHYKGQHFPEMPSYGWRYSNFRMEMHAGQGKSNKRNR